MSYVDLMGNLRWSEHDHIRRTEAMVREHWSLEDETIINRKVVGALSGMNVLTAQDQADIADFKGVTEAAQAAGIDARVDAAMLHAALDVEDAKQRLDAVPPPPLPDPENPDATPEDPYAAERAARQAEYQALIGAASPEVLQLLDDRAAYRAAQNPPPAVEEPAPEVQP